MKKALPFLILLGVLLFSLQAASQRLSTGITVGVNTLQNLKLKDNFLFPQNSYFIYYVANEEKDDKPEFDQWINGFSAGININLDYKRFMLTMEWKGTSQSTKLKALYPTPFGQLLENDLSEFKLTRNSWSLPLLLTVKLNSKANGPFLLGGLQYEWNFYNMENGFGSDLSDGINLFTADTELYGILYNEHNYWSYIAGIGYKRNDTYLSVRFVKRTGGDESLYPEARYFLIETVLAKTLNFQKLKKGHIIYTE